VPTDTDATVSVRTRVAGAVTAAALIGVGLFLLLDAARWRGLETILAAHLINGITSARVTGYSSSSVILLDKGHQPFAELVLNAECTVAYIMGVILVIAGPLALLRRVGWRRALLAAAAACVIIEIANIVRLAGIGLAVVHIGTKNGFTLAHTYLGTVLMFVATALAGALFIALLFYRRGWSRPQS
jgi:exosortase/archaeosortase family protein